MKTHLAIDIGASSGRHVIGYVRDGAIHIEEVYRFDNTLTKRGGHLCWDMDALFEHVLAGMAVCAKKGLAPATLAIDTWGVDFVLLDGRGTVLGDTVAYRDSRTQGADALVEQTVPFEALYARTGIQKQLFNTVYQLEAIRRDNAGLLEQAQTLLMVPDYLNYLLTGQRRQEYTNATTTALVNAQERDWDRALIEKLGFPAGLFGPLAMPGGEVGGLSGEVRRRAGFDCTVLHAASHDTASAFMAVPASAGNAATLSSGTWSLLGLETEPPITTPAAQAANFTNEGGYAHRYRFLKNIMGLWMIQSIRQDYGKRYSFAQLEQQAVASAHFATRVDVNSPAFLAPASMVEAVQRQCAKTGQPVPQTVGEVAACVYQSLSDSYAAAIGELEAITGKTIITLHIVGGGSKDGYLNSLTAEKTGLPVLAGPVEGTVVGNLMAQMIASGAFADLAAARRAVAASFPIREYRRDKTGGAE